MSNYKRTLLSNKENTLHITSAFSSVERHSSSLHKPTLSSSKANLIPKENCNSVSDSRLKLVMDHKDELQKMYDDEKQRSKQENSQMRAQVYELEQCNDRLEQTIIEYEGEVDAIRKKLKIQAEKSDVLQKNLERLQREREQTLSKSNNSGVQGDADKNKLEQKFKILRRQKQNLEDLHKAMKANYERLESELIKARQSQKSLSSHKSTEERQLEEMRKQWEKDVKHYQTQIRDLVESESNLTQLVAKSEMKIKIQENDLEFKNQKIQALEQGIVELTAKLTQTYSKLEAINSHSQQRQQEHKRVSAEMEKMFKQQIQSLLQKTQTQISHNQAQMEKDLASKFSQDLQAKQMHIEENLALVDELQNKNEQWREQYKRVVESRDELEKQVSTLKITLLKTEQGHEEVDREYEEQIARIHLQLEQEKEKVEGLEKGYDIQIGKNKQCLQLIECFKKKVEEKEEMFKRDCDLIHSLEQAYSQKEGEYEVEINKLQTQLSEQTKKHDKQKQALKSQIQCLESQIEKWKNYRNQFNQQFEDLRRENRKLKKQICEERQSAIKLQASKVTQLQDTVQMLQTENKKINQKHEQDLLNIRKQLTTSHQEELEEMRKQLSVQLKTKIEKQLKEVHMNEVKVLRRQFQQEKNKYQEKSSTIQRQFQSAKKQSYETSEEIDAKNREISEKNREISEKNREINEKNREIKLLLEKTKDLERVIAKETKNCEEIRSSIRKYKELDEEKLWIIQEGQQKSKKLESLNRKLEHEIGKVRQEHEEIEKEKWSLQDKILGLQKNNSRLQAVKNQLEQELVSSHSQFESSQTLQIERLTQAVRLKNEEIESLICAKKSIEQNFQIAFQNKISQLETKIKSMSQLNQVLQAEASLAKELSDKNKALMAQLDIKANELSNCEQQKQKMSIRVQIMEKEERQKQLKLAQLQRHERREVYMKLASVSNEFFDLEYRESQGQIQFLTILYHKLRIWVDYTEKLKEQAKKYKSLDCLREEDFNRSKGKQMAANLNLKEDYEVIYRKYLKYKEAYTSCRGKIEKQRHDILQDQRFTDEIITHCKTFIGKTITPNPY